MICLGLDNSVMGMNDADTTKTGIEVLFTECGDCLKICQHHQFPLEIPSDKPYDNNTTVLFRHVES